MVRVPSLLVLAATLRDRPHYAPARETAVAAVVTLLRAGPSSVEVLFIERATREGDPWSGHIAFPGGRRGPGETSLLATAMRETEEEVGLRLAPASLLTRLDDFVTRSHDTQVAQFVFELDDPDAPLVPNAEVASVLWAPIDVLLSPEHAGTMTLAREGLSFELPTVRLGDDRILWGMTHRMTQALLVALGFAPPS